MSALNRIERDRSGKERRQKVCEKPENEGFYRSLIQHAPNVILFLSPDHRILEFNPEAEQLYGRKRADVLGKNYLELFLPDDVREVVAADIEKVLTGEASRGFENIVIAQDGRERILSWNVDRVLDSDNNPVGIVAVGQDITEGRKTDQALRESEDKYRSLVTHIPDVVWSTDHEGRTILISSNVEKVYGYTPEEIYQQGERLRFKRIHPDDAERVKEAFKAVFEKGEQLDIEYRIRRKDGEWIWLRDRSVGAYEKDGEKYADGVLSDITERKLTEIECKENRDRLHNLIENMPIVCFTFERDGRILSWNHAAEQVYGYKKDEAVGASAYDLIVTQATRQATDRVIQDVFNGKTVEGSEWQDRDKDGKIGWRMGNTFPLFNVDGTVSCGVNMNINITDRKRTEEKLNKARGLLQAAIEQTPAGILIADAPEVKIRAANAAALEIRREGLQTLTQIPVECHPKSWQTFHLDGTPYKPEDLPLSKAVLKGITTKNEEVIIRRQDGEERWVLANAAPVRDADGQVVAGVVVFPDITKRKEAERELQKYQEQLKSLASELSFAEERERRRVAAGIHDNIAQKLAMAKFGLQSLRASVSDSELLGTLDKQCQLMDQIVSDARSLTFELSNPVLYEVGLEAAVESYLAERIQGELGIECKFRSEGPRPTLEEDIKAVLFQAARELLANVVKHANANTVEVYISNSEDELRIIVEDDGVGFDRAGVGPNGVGEGGFGLFNIRERLEYFGGDLKIETGHKNGARVCMTVPFTADAIA